MTCVWNVDGVPVRLERGRHLFIAGVAEINLSAPVTQIRDLEAVTRTELDRYHSNAIITSAVALLRAVQLHGPHFENSPEALTEFSHLGGSLDTDLLAVSNQRSSS